LRKHALLHGRRADIRSGSFDDPIGNMQRFADQGTDLVVSLDLFDAYAPALETVLRGDREGRLRGLADSFRQRLALSLERAASVPQVLVALLHRLGNAATGDPSDPVDEAIATFNRIIADE